MEEGENEPDAETVTIKCGLQASLKVPELLPLIERGVKFVSILSVRGSRLVNGFLLANPHALPSLVDIKSSKRFIYQTFKLGVGTRPLRNPTPGLLEWYVNQTAYEPPPNDLPPQWKEISEYACNTYLTVFLNNLWMNYESRLMKFLRALYGEASGGVNDNGTAMLGMVGEAETLCHLICRFYDSGYNHKRAHIAPTLEQTQLINEQRQLFGLTDVWGPQGRLNEGRLKRHSNALLSTSIRYLRAVEVSNATIPPRFSKYLIKGWTVAPLCSRKRHNMTIDAAILMQMMKEIVMIDKKMTLEQFWPLAVEHFDSVFQVRRPDDENRRRRTSHGPSKQLVPRCYVQTDGVVLNAQFQLHVQERVKGGSRALKKRKAEASRENKKENDGDEGSSKPSAKCKRAEAKRDKWVYKGEIYDDQIIVSIDPGRVNIMYAYRDTDGKTFQLTRGQFQEEGGIYKSRNKWLKWNYLLRGVYEHLGENSPKTASVQGWNNFLAVDTTHAPQIWSVNYSKQASRMRFHTYCNTKRVMDKFVSSFGKGLGLSNDERKRRLLVGYGHARFAPSGKGEMAVPTTQSFKTVAKMCKTKIINENYSTVVCADCHGRLKKVQTDILISKNGRTFRKDNRGVHRCSSACKTNGNPLKHRDKNAARNIREILREDIAGNDRPIWFTRAGAPR